MTRSGGWPTPKAGSPTTRYDYDGQDLITELDANGNVLRRYVHGPDTDEPLVWYEGAGAGDRRWLHADERGSVIAVTGGTGARIALNTYDAFGMPGAGNSGRFQYTGQTWLPEVGLYYYKARMYDPKIGRFLQPDPIGVAGGVNLYAYAGNDPVNATDPSGLACRSVEATGIIDESTGNSYNSTVVCDGGGGSPSFPPFGFPGGGIDYGREFGNGGDGGPAPVVPDIIEMTPELQDKICKSGPVITIGVGLDLVIGGGGVLDAGVALDFGNRLFGIIPDVSFYGTGGKSVGVDVSAGLSVGIFKDKSALQGNYKEIEAGLLAGSIAGEFNGKGQFVGSVVTLGPGLPASAHATQGNGYLLDVINCP